VIGYREIVSLGPTAPAVGGRASASAWLILLGLVVAAAALRYLLFANTTHFDPAAFADQLCRWDCPWYRGVADGYHQGIPTNRQGRGNWAFFPLYPVTAGLLSKAAQIPFPLAGYLLSNLFGLLAAGIARPLFGTNVRAYWLFAFGLLLGPFSLLFSLSYSESLFILLTLAGMVALRRADYPRAGFVGALLSATRVTGVLFGLAIAMQALVDRLRIERSWRSFATLLADWRLLLGLVLAPLGLILYAVYLRLWMGDGLAFMHTQIGWNRELDNPLIQLWNGAAQGFPFRMRWTEETSFVWSAVVGLALTGVLAAKKRYAEAVFCLAVILISLSAGLDATLRYVAGLAPLGVVLAELLSTRRWLSYLSYAAAFVLGLLAFYGWLHGEHVMV
jgi:hypothetical protein